MYMIKRTPEEAKLIRAGEMDYSNEDAAKAVAPKIEETGAKYTEFMGVVRQNRVVIAAGGLATAAVIALGSFNASERLADFSFFNGGAEQVVRPGDILDDHMRDGRHQEIQNLIDQGVTEEAEINQILEGEE